MQRIACCIQVFALSRWLAVTLPVEYYEFTGGIEWSIPYFGLPWESSRSQGMFFIPDTSTSSRISEITLNGSAITQTVQFDKGISSKSGVVYGAPLTATTRIFSLKLNISWTPKIQPGMSICFGLNSITHLHFISTEVQKESSKTRDLWGSGFATIRDISSDSRYTLHLSSFNCLAQRLLQYKEVHTVDRKFHWYQELVRVTLGPVKRGQWTWKSQQNSIYLAKFGPLFEDLRGPPKYMLSMITGETHMPVDRIIAWDDETEDAEAPFIQRLFGVLRIYYTLLESIRRFLLGILAGLHSENSVSKARPLSCYQLLLSSFSSCFSRSLSPRKKVQLVEIMSIACEVGFFATCLPLLEKEISIQAERVIGISMLPLFIFGFLALIINEWYALFKQVKKLDTAKNAFQVGLKAVLLGFILLFIPEKLIKNLQKWLPEDKAGPGNGDVSRLNRTGTNSNRNTESRSPSLSDKLWLKQLREMAKASFKEASGSTPTDPSSNNPRWSGFWHGKWSRSSSSKTPSHDYKSRLKSLYKDLEAIFASKLRV